MAEMRGERAPCKRNSNVHHFLLQSVDEHKDYIALSGIVLLLFDICSK